MTTMTPVLAEDDVAPEGTPPGGGTFIEPLVARMHADFGIDPGVARRLAVEVLADFAGARVQSFVPILVEKRLREIFRSAG